MAAVSFPILRLPQSALKNALRQMCLMEHLILSVLSTKAKQQVTMLNEVRQYVSLIVTSSELSFDLQSKKNYYNLSIKLNLSNVRICKRFSFGNEFTAKQWIDHIRSVFLKNASLTLSVQNPEKRMLEERYEYIRELRIVNFKIHSAEIQDSPLHKMFPLLKCLSFEKVPKSKSILIQNLKELQFKMSKVTLNHFTDISKFGDLYLWVSTCPSRFSEVEQISHVFRDVDVIDIAVGSIENPMDTAKFKNGTDDGGFHKIVSTAECITFIPSEYESPQLTHQIMIQSFECIQTEIRRESLLNQLLATNATTVLQKYSSNTPWKDLNLLLKLWMAGANPNLNFIQIVCITNIQDVNLILEILLQGIKYQVASPEKIRFKPYRRPVRHPFDFEIEGGFDVVRHDGCRATITVGAWEEQDSYCFKMKIWS